MKAQDRDRTERQGVHLVGSRLERAGFAVREQASSDYGIDAIAELIEAENATGRLVALQVKAGASYLDERGDDFIVYRPSTAHVNYWLSHTLPVVVCLCDLDQEIVYWQRIALDTIKRTGKGFKVEIPENQVLDNAARSPLIDIVTPRVASTDYTLVRTEDVSHGLAKRYSIRVVLNRSMTKPELAAVVRAMTKKTAKRRYSRNQMVKGRWGDTDAHVVWTFIYPSTADEKQSNYICRSLWIDPNLALKHAPLPLAGEDVGDGIIVDWRESTLGTLGASQDLDFGKEDYLDLVDPILETVTQSLKSIHQALEKWRAGAYNEKDFLKKTSPARSRVSEACGAHAHCPEAPYECQDLNVPVESLMASADNIILFHSDVGQTTWSSPVRMTMTASALADATKALERVNYEREKVS
ncbi:hypothetical protein BH23BAC4_BH23BAC4_03210 [soil metagenome]